MRKANRPSAKLGVVQPFHEVGLPTLTLRTLGTNSRGVGGCKLFLKGSDLFCLALGLCVLSSQRRLANGGLC